MDFFDIANPHLYVAIGLSVLNGVLLCIVGYKFLQILQLTGYKLRGFYAWTRQTKGNYIIRLIMLALIGYSCMLAVNFLLQSLLPKNSNYSYFGYLSMIFYLYFIIYFSIHLRGKKNTTAKTPLKYTKRMNRLIGVLMLLSTGFTFMLFWLGHYDSNFAIATSIIGLSPIALTFLVPLSFYIMAPFELLNNKAYLDRAKRKLAKLEKEKLIYKIGITGSYGKTSVKNILKTLLEEKYNVVASPASFNTPMGLTKTILQYLYREHDVLICEMGARRRDDIKKLCKIVRPDISILTAIGTAHLETFGTVEKIKQAKFEIMRALPALGYAVFNGENEGCNTLYEMHKTEKVKTGFDKEHFIYAKNMRFTCDGTKFLLCMNGEEYKAETKLLGKAYVENILMAAAVCTRLRLTPQEIVAGIKKLEGAPHRMQLIPGGKDGVSVIDNTYNSNTAGASASLAILSLFEGDKYVATPGMIELGAKQFESNKKFGSDIAKVAKGAFVINEINKQAIVEGLIDGGMDKDAIVVCKTLDEAKERFSQMLKAGDAILLENDLPDNYN